jgi:hypothetical protein
MLPGDFLDALRSNGGPCLSCLAGSIGAGKSMFLLRIAAPHGR